VTRRTDGFENDIQDLAEHGFDIRAIAIGRRGGLGGQGQDWRRHDGWKKKRDEERERKKRG
jgi:hypothetical protein